MSDSLLAIPGPFIFQGLNLGVATSDSKAAI
jgi:hypothetical protein